MAISPGRARENGGGCSGDTTALVTYQAPTAAIATGECFARARDLRAGIARGWFRWRGFVLSARRVLSSPVRTFVAWCLSEGCEAHASNRSFHARAPDGALGLL